MAAIIDDHDHNLWLYYEYLQLHYIITRECIQNTGSPNVHVEESMVG